MRNISQTKRPTSSCFVSFVSFCKSTSVFGLKRSSPAEILEAVTAVRQGGVPMTGEIARKVIMAFQSPASVTG